MNIFDIIVIIFIIISMAIGYSKGLIKEGVSLIGNLIVIIISFGLMDSVASIMYKTLPFLDLGFFGIHITSLNILVYQLLAFVIILLILKMILGVILAFTGIIETLIDMIPIFSTVSKIFGTILGLFSGYVIAFVILTILSVPFSSNETFHEAKFSNFVINHTPMLTNRTRGLHNTVDEIYKLSIKINKDENRIKNSKEYNASVLEIMLKNGIVKYETVESLIKDGKLKDIEDNDNYMYRYQYDY